MAERIHLKLKGNKQGDIKGDSSQVTDNRKDSIEVTFYEQAALVPTERGSAGTTGRREFTKLKIQKNIDSSSPLLWSALVNNEALTGEFSFYRTHAGDGHVQQFYSVKIEGARIVGLKQVSPDALDRGDQVRDPFEEVEFVFNKISWEFKGDKKTMAEDEWSKPRNG
jgi:type VI secretion system secreted protein Hcp